MPPRLGTICYHSDMAALLIRNLDDATVTRLKQRARRNKRSLQGEVSTILEAAARPTTVRKGAARRPLRLHTVRVGARTTWSRDELYDDDAR